MIPPAESDAGLLAYEQVLAFAALRRRKLPWVYALFTLVLAAAGVAFLVGNYEVVGAAWLAAAVAFAIFSIWNWRRLVALDTRNRALLAQLRAQYGDDLPWLEVERHLAALEKLEAEASAKGATLPPEEPK